MMVVLNLFAGPCSGKSTTAAEMFAFLKRKHVRTELVGEEAKDCIYAGNERILGNQFYLAAMQYARLKNLEWSGCQVAIADSPLLMSTSYATHLSYYDELVALSHKVNGEFDNLNIFLHRGQRPYQEFGRQQTYDEAKTKDSQIFSLFKDKFHTIFFDHEGETLRNWLETKLKDRKIIQ